MTWQYECIDVNIPSGSICKKYNGTVVPYDAHSVDLVIFLVVFHHVQDGVTFDLIREAHRVSRRYVYLMDCYQALTPERALRNFIHQPTAIFRGPKEWRQIFVLHGFSIVAEQKIVFPCFSGRHAYERFYSWVLKNKNLTDDDMSMRVMSRNLICQFRPTVYWTGFFLST